MSDKKISWTDAPKNGIRKTKTKMPNAPIYTSGLILFSRKIAKLMVSKINSLNSPSRLSQNILSLYSPQTSLALSG